MGQIYVKVYCLPIGVTMAAVLMLALAWCVLWPWAQKRPPAVQRRSRCLLAALLVLWLAVILHMTVFSRTPGMPEAELMPLHQLWMYFHGGTKELLRTMWMNVLLFVPGGLLLTALWPQKWQAGCRLLDTVVVLTAVSVAVEWCQFHGGLGVAETDDVLCNGLGAAIGAIIHRAAELTEA